MSTMQDIRMAKQTYEDHVEQHRCRIGRCDRRRQLWLFYQKVGEQWGR